MGCLNFGAPREIIEKMRSSFGITTFVETGTYLGGTASWASERFEKVYTIEGSADFRRQAQERHADKHNIDFLLGDSRTVLGEVVARLGNASAVFWLDAHWMPGSFGKNHECPLLEEIAAIQQSPTPQFILIDDARLFLAPPPLPHRAQDWPDITAVLAALHAPRLPAVYTVVYDDVIFSIPDSARQTMQGFYQEQITAATAAASAPPPVHPVRKALGKIKRRVLGQQPPA